MTSTMLFDPVGHVDDEALDLFCGERLSLDDHEAVRQHLRFCGECRDRADGETYFRSAIVEQRDLLEAPPPPENARRQRLVWSSGLFSWRPLAALASLAVAALLLPRLTEPVKPPSPADVMLQAMRGTEGGEAPAGRPLILRLDLAALSSRAGLEVQLVDRLGQPIARGRAQPEGDHALFPVEARLTAGQYWVRLWQGAELVREYSLRVR